MQNFRTNLIEKLTKKNLLPDDLEKKREESRVLKLPTKTYPEGYFKYADGKDGKNAEFNDKSYPGEELIGKSGSTGNLSLYRKAFPHCLYGMMLVKNHNINEIAITDFSEQERHDFFKIAEEFARFSELQGIYPNISWTFDPDTRDRKSGQSQLWYHMHLNSHTPESKKQILAGRKELKNIGGKETKRSFIDEFSVLASKILKDYFEKSGVKLEGQMVGPFEFDNLPNFGILSEEGWEYILSKGFNNDLVKVHEAILMIYEEIKKLLFIGDSGEWKRPEKNGQKITGDAFPWMNPDTINAINIFVQNLDSKSIEERKEVLINNPKSALTSHLYPLGGPSYAITITKVDESKKILVSVRPQMFSETGAAGLHHVFGTTVKLARGSEIYSSEELKSKNDFENGFVDFLKDAKFS
jgi:hypothetical protein